MNRSLPASLLTLFVVLGGVTTAVAQSHVPLNIPRINASSGAKTTPVAASSARLSTVAWLEGDRALATRFDFRAALDRPPIVLGEASQGLPTAASDGDDFLVAWNLGSEFVWRILRADGTLGAEGRGRGASPRARWTGDSYFIVSTDGSYLNFFWIESDGLLRRSTRMALPFETSVAAIATQIAMLRAAGGLTVERISPDGVALSKIQLSTATVRAAQIDTDGKEFIVSWIEIAAPPFQRRSLRVVRVQESGAVPADPAVLPADRTSPPHLR